MAADLEGFGVGDVAPLAGIAGLATVLGDSVAGNFLEAAAGSVGFLVVGVLACGAGDLAEAGGVSVFFAVLGVCKAGDLVPVAGVGEATALLEDGNGGVVRLSGAADRGTD